ncbi:glycosyltransferase [Halalkalibacter sp. AB-rgal2]|uniref:glycosyltransferase n=1 Tax=Halalkalibacter sp. AB-rgal2 TaxID=3242695 RepID=UPI00359CE329
MKKRTILLLIRKFHLLAPKHQLKFDMMQALEAEANVLYWHEDGSILDILASLEQKPDFILHYDIAWGYYFAPRITDLEKVDIPKGCYVMDIHWEKAKRLHYFLQSKVDLVFSVTKTAFLANFPMMKQKFRWLPFSINDKVIKDWAMPKDITYLLMGLVYLEGEHHPPKGRYPFREEVVNQMRDVEGFTLRKHPGHFTKNATFINEMYSKELNRSSIFFTCGGAFKYPVMKYFEALGSRTLLIAESNEDIIELGFKDGEHYVACECSEIYEKALFYYHNEQERMRITNNGFRWIHTHHTNEIRAKQCMEMIEKCIHDK